MLSFETRENAEGMARRLDGVLSVKNILRRVTTGEFSESTPSEVIAEINSNRNLHELDKRDLVGIIKPLLDQPSKSLDDLLAFIRDPFTILLDLYDAMHHLDLRLSPCRNILECFARLLPGSIQGVAPRRLQALEGHLHREVRMYGDGNREICCRSLFHPLLCHWPDPLRIYFTPVTVKPHDNRRQGWPSERVFIAI